MKKLLISCIIAITIFSVETIYCQDINNQKSKFSIGLNFGGMQRNLSSLNNFFEQNNLNQPNANNTSFALDISFFGSKWNHHIGINTFSNQSVVANTFSIPNVSINTNLLSYSIGKFIKNTSSYSVLGFGGLGYATNTISLERGTVLASFPNVVSNLVSNYNRVSFDRNSLNLLIGIGVYKKLFKERFWIGGRVTYTNGFYAADTWKFYRGNAVSDVPDLGLGILSYQLGVNYMIMR